MKTEKLYDTDPYGREFEAEIVEITESNGCFQIELDKTLFFPEEGGQSSDTGTLGGLRVVHVSLQEGRILHEVTGRADFKPGEVVFGVIDWDRRFSNMQNHTGEHVLSGILHRDYASENKGFHLSDNIVTLDTSRQLSGEEIAELERKANEAVYADIPVTCRYYEPSELSVAAAAVVGREDAGDIHLLRAGLAGETRNRHGSG